MAYGQVRKSGRFFAGRGAILAGILAFHGVVIVALSQMGPNFRFKDDSPPVEVVFIDQSADTPAPAPPQVKLADVRPVDIVAPIVDISITEPAPNAITVAPPKATPPAPVVASNADIPVMVDGVDYMRPPSPHYPQSARRARVQGTVLLRVLIDRDGRPREVRVHRSSGSQQLDSAACDSVREALFKPYRENGEPRSAQVIIPIEFSLTIRTASRS